MSVRVVGQPSEPSRRAAGRASGRRAAWWLGPARATAALSRPALCLWRRLGKKPRFKIKIAAAAVLLASPVWVLNLVVAFLGHSVVFPLSPFFMRQKFAAIVLYARHRPACLAYGHEATDLQVKRAQRRHRLPPGLLAAVVQVESRGFPHRISAAGAMGPGQLMPDTARELGVADPFDTGENIEGAARLLASHLARFHNVRLAVAAYNAGPGAVHGHVPRNGQTPVYVDRVMQAYAALRPAPPSPRAAPSRNRVPHERARARAVRGPALALTGPSGEER